MTTFRIITWNIQATKGCDDQYNATRIVKYIKNSGNWDIICLQEVARHMPSMNSEDQLSTISTQFPEYELAWAPGFSTFYLHRKRCEFGNLTLVKRSAFKNSRAHHLPSPRIEELQMPRTVSEVVARLGDFELSVLNTHLAFHSSDERAAQMHALTQLRNQYLDKLDLPTHKDATGPYSYSDQVHGVILCGDLNICSDSSEYSNHIVAKGWIDCWDKQTKKTSVHGIKRAPTCGCFDAKQWSQGPHVRDYFLASENLAGNIDSVIVDVETDASDHQPVMMEIKI